MEYKYKVTEKEISLNSKCLICDTPITDEEFAFEDYYVVFRGHSGKCFYGVICFECLRKFRKYILRGK